MKSNNTTSLNIIAILFIAILLIISWKLILPSYAANSDKLQTLDMEITNAQAKLDSLDEVRNDLSSIDATFEKISVAIPDGADEPNLITELEAIAVKNGIVLPSVSITEESASDSNYDEDASQAQYGVPISISFSVTGSFDSLNQFIVDLEKSIKFLNITDLNYAYSEDGNISLSLVIEAYGQSDQTLLSSEE